MTSGFATAEISAAIRGADARSAALEQELNAADAKLGDGDAGGMLKRVLGRLAAAPLDDVDDVGAAFGVLARAVAGATGSSLGTLFTTALLAASKGTASKKVVAWSDLGRLLDDGATAMMARGGAKLGDKTVVDALHAVAEATAGIEDPIELKRVAVESARDALDRYRDKTCRIGRARMFAERSVGSDDPGMLALLRLVESICDAN
jgi:phosphoenolpyruvate---glycerone phosphotransferase subunit DhaL